MESVRLEESDGVELRAELIRSAAPEVRELIDFAFTIGAGYVSPEIVNGYHSALAKVEGLLEVSAQKLE